MRFSSLAAWLDWQTSLNPREIELGLGRVRQVWHALGAPSVAPVVITVAGTNGKGSSVAFVESILHAAGYSVGCYTSPHLRFYRERIRVQREAIDEQRILEAFDAIDQARGDFALTYFEFGTLAALWVFAHEGLDAAVLEVGLGGRLDAVNLIDPDVALITSIGLDHQDWLGNDIETIAAEKAGIMRAGRPVVFSGRDMPASIRRVADEVGAELLVAGEHFQVERGAEGWRLIIDQQVRGALPQPGLRGRVQVDNAAGAIVALDRLSDRLPVDQRAVRTGLLDARVAGRFEVRPGQPTWVLDVAHNPQAAAVLNDMLGDCYTPGKRIAVCGMLADKDAAGVAAVLAQRFDAWFLVDLSSQLRGLSAHQLAEKMVPELPGVDVHASGTVATVLERLVTDTQPDDLLVVFGSFLTVGDAMAWLDGDDCSNVGD